MSSLRIPQYLMQPADFKHVQVVRPRRSGKSVMDAESLLARLFPAPPRVAFTPEQIQMLRDAGVKGAGQ